ncbi:hypothetical protein MC7420_4603 [Coleofasciculus chthonoplastes PCC 7420]|uniref:DUF4123 domain-containing protein n=1 Tax=Coleofasciculus chthonoplastes PCC 7420 TaxID=118168 RepID=B4VNJ6_9CYAN|nr:DUF4123 domain-containing protein [Coleofasciculus chthonoplastes]EDX76347.1 hypothetical protein MC7420_4603 [Coleofasciculus chthonoplastes PCC 7420]
MTNIDPDKIINYLWGQKQSHTEIYALLDSANDPKIYDKINQINKNDYCCLYPDKVAKVLAEVAPYLVKVKLDKQSDSFIIFMLTNGWKKSWGLLLESSAPLNKLQEHFQGLLRVKDETGKSFYFRYYDPRILRVYLPTCTQEELKIVFGSSVMRYWIESENGNNILEFPPKEGKSYLFQ